MTHDEIMAMDADALRLAIAQVKGWKWEPVDYEIDRRGGRWRSPSNSLWDDPANWPGDIAAAWTLVEEMREAGREPAVIWHPTNNDWLVSYFGEDHYFKTMHGDSAPATICRAYLLWKAAQ